MHRAISQRFEHASVNSATSLRVAVITDELRMQRYYFRALHAMGHAIVGVAVTTRELATLCTAHNPDLILADIMPALGDAL